jgi:hypothetical protein
MKIFAMSSTRLLLALAAGLAVARGQAAEVDVQSPTKRQESLDRAKKLLATREIPAPAADPFHSEAFNEIVASVGRAPAAATTGGEAEGGKSAAGPRTGRDQLKAIAEGLKPSGYYVFGGQPTLTFGQKRVKAGGFVTITFEGTEYTCEIVSIVSPNFTLRLNREEFTRPIK